MSYRQAEKLLKKFIQFRLGSAMLREYNSLGLEYLHMEGTGQFKPHYDKRLKWTQRDIINAFRTFTNIMIFSVND